MKNKRGLATTDQSLFELQNKFRKIPLLVMYYLIKFEAVEQLQEYDSTEVTLLEQHCCGYRS